MSVVDDLRSVRLLIKHGADVNFQRETGNGTALNRAIGLAQLDVAEYLIESGTTAKLDHAAYLLQGRTLPDEQRRQRILQMLVDRGAKLTPPRVGP